MATHIAIDTIVNNIIQAITHHVEQVLHPHSSKQEPVPVLVCCTVCEWLIGI